MKNPLLDKEFLKELDKHREKEVWAKIIALTVDEEPVEEISGKIISGNLGIDGSSSVRRTCSLSMVAEDININNYYWGLKNKFKLEIGLTNRINSNYPEIIWFKQGTYVITSFNTSHTTNNYTISLQGQDKMCLLNGTVGGSLTALSYRFDSYDQVDNETEMVTTIKYPIKEIITEMVHEYAQEPYYNIIVNDLDDKALELLEYRGSSAMWMLVGASGDNTDIVINATLDKNTPIYLTEDKGNHRCTIKEFDEVATAILDKNFEKPQDLHGVKCIYDKRIDRIDGSSNEKPTLIRKASAISGLKYTLLKIEQGETVGYRLSDIIYPSELIESVGSPITSALDKIKNMLGNFEYFYDDDGRFVFQKKKTFIDESWNNIQRDSDNSIYVEDAVYTTPFEYVFEGSELISSFSNSPQLNNVKNDFSIWGTKKSVTGNEVPVHLRYAIDKKPYYYKSLDISKEDAREIRIEYYNMGNETKIEEREGKEYYTSEYNSEGAVDWRELIYQMALDFRKYGHWSQYNVRLNKENILGNEPVYIGGDTKYQQYYTDLEGFWRQLYNPDIEQELDKIQKEIDKETDENKKAALENKRQQLRVDWNTETFWTTQIDKNPESLTFWFDFLDIDGELAQFSIPAIGHRPKAINDSAVKGIYFKETPLVVFVNAQEEK